VKQGLLLFILLCFTSNSYSADSKYLISEMEKLRDSLSLEDPARIDLTLRLADLYFDDSIKEGNEADYKTLKNNRLKAFDLYKHSLSVTNVNELTKLKIKFQMARLLSRLEEFKKAEAYYSEVLNHKNVPPKMKEQSSLALAEWFEEDAKYKKSEKHYDMAISLCKTKTACNYAHYRKAWLYFKDTKLEKAISEMKASLWSSETEIRESSLQDLILFMSNNMTEGEAELETIKEIVEKTNRPVLVQKMAEAFYVAGNRKAGSNLLTYINQQSPSLYFEVRLLEEVYGFRKWEKVGEFLTSLEKRSSVDIPAKKEHADEVLKIFRRFLVQIDSEATVVEDLNPYLKRSIDIYLNIYPNDDLRKKLQEGWLKAETSEVAKVERIGKWIEEDTAFGLNQSHIRKLRQTRLSLAQKLKLSDIVIAESKAIVKILGETDEAKEFHYVTAREYYTQKKYDQALPLFQKLINDPNNKVELNKWALLSQNLVLDIYNGRGEYANIVKQVALWTDITKDSKDKKVVSENKQMDQLKIDARFALAVKMKESPESLKTFYDFCFAGIKPAKSCSNAKVLAIKMEDQEKVISLLEKEGDKKTLMTEYELMGRFSDAAALQEKFNLNHKSDTTVFLKIALLYELDNNLKERDRILKKLIRKIKRDKSIPEKYEGAIYLTLKDAGMIDGSSLALPWSLKRKLRLATTFEQVKPNKKTQKLILSQTKSQGPVWSRLVLKKVQKDFFKIGKISFYGRASAYRFKKRTKGIARFAKVAKGHLNGADLETRTYLLHMLERAYGQLVEDILATPLPPDLDEATMAAVQIKLQNMSDPFEKVRSDYNRLLEEQLLELKEADQVRIKANLDTRITDYSELVPLEEIAEESLASLDQELIEKEKAKLLKFPSNKESLTNLMNYYQNAKRPRLQAYFTGRLESREKSSEL
jgi:hypothetical protein